MDNRFVLSFFLVLIKLMEENKSWLLNNFTDVHLIDFIDVNAMVAARMLATLKPVGCRDESPELNEALWSLLRQGLYDRDGNNDPLNLAAQQSMKYSAAVALRILHKHSHLETEVGNGGCTSFACKANVFPLVICRDRTSHSSSFRVV